MTEFSEKYINADLAYFMLMKRAKIDSQPRAFRRAAKFLLELPTSDVRQNIYGRWVFDEADNMFSCSVCKQKSPRNDYPFCHWCGAIMIARKEEDDG